MLHSRTCYNSNISINVSVFLEFSEARTIKNQTFHTAEFNTAGTISNSSS